MQPGTFSRQYAWGNREEQRMHFDQARAASQFGQISLSGMIALTAAICFFMKVQSLAEKLVMRHADIEIRDI
jgi:acyl dehydratase